MTMQTVRHPAPFLVSVAGVTVASPALTVVHIPRCSLNTGYSDLALSTVASARNSHTDCPASDISGGNRREPADQTRSYASQLKDAYAPIDLGQNPALAALAANLVRLTMTR